MEWKEWKWSDGSVAERSPRIQPNVEEIIPVTNITIPKEIIDNNAYLQSLNCDYGADFRENNKREDSYTKMAEREMIAQIGQNPFFINNNDDIDGYANQLSIQDKFLKPISTIDVDKTKISDSPQPTTTREM
jgi:hypothetical protein